MEHVGQRNRCSHTVDEVNRANHGNPANSVLYQTLCSDRWCPYELALLKTKFPGSGFYFVSNLDRPGAGSQGCTEHQCFAYQLDQESYRTKLNEENCSCPEAFGDRRLVISLLATALLGISALFEAMSNRKYAAISRLAGGFREPFGRPLFPVASCDILTG
jgi:hypothetical protein